MGTPGTHPASSSMSPPDFSRVSIFCAVHSEQARRDTDRGRKSGKEEGGRRGNGCAFMDVPEEDNVRDPGFEMVERADTFGTNDLAAEVAERYPAGNSSAAGAVANFVNTIVGAGIVGLPFALAQVCGELCCLLHVWRTLAQPHNRSNRQTLFRDDDKARTTNHGSTATGQDYCACNS